MTRPFDTTTAVIAGLGFGSLATYLLFDQQPGLGYTLLIAAFVVLLFGLGYAHRLRPLRANSWLVAPLLFFSSMVTLRTNSTLTAVNMLLGLGVLALLVATWDRQPVSHFTLSGYGLTGLVAGVNAAVRPFVVIADLIARGARQGTRHVVRPIVVGLLIAIPCLGIFTLLFASADPIFARALGDLWRGVDVAKLIGHLVFALVGAWLAVGLLDLALGYRLRPFTAGLAGAGWRIAKPPARVEPRGPLGITETSIVLALILALFTTFVVFQLRYLFLPEDQLGYDFNTITYSEYAREGFFQLLVVTALVIVLLVALERLTRRTKGFHNWLFKALTAALVCCAFVVLASSFRRLQLYGFEHSFTHLRLFSHSFTIWLAVVLVLLLVSIFSNRPRVFAFGLLLSILVYIAALDVMNPDAFIASANLDHTTIYGKPLDRRNFVPLGQDAVPVLVSRLDELDPINRRAIEQLLYLQLAETERATSGTGWQSLNASRDAALRLLTPRKGSLASACAAGSERPSTWAPGDRDSLERRQQLIHELHPLCFRPPGT